MAGSSDQSATARQMWVDRLPSWVFLIGLALLFVLLWGLNVALGPGNFIDENIWKPLSQTGNYNPYNTGLLMVVLGLVLGWIYRLMSELHERVDLELTVAVVPYLVWGSVYHVLEDSDLFAPFSEAIRASGGTGDQLDASCWPAVNGDFLHSCLGVFFQTPVIYVVVTIIAVFLFWVGHVAARVGRSLGLPAGLRFVAYMFVGAFALYLALWAAHPTFIRWVANPLVALGALLLGYWIVWRDAKARGQVNPRWVLLAYGVSFLVVGLYYVFTWMAGGTSNWKPSSEVSWWVFAALLLGPLIVALSSRIKARYLSGTYASRPSTLRKVAEPTRHLVLLIALVVVDGLMVFISMVGFHNAEELLDKGELFAVPMRVVGIALMLLAGPLAFLLTNFLVKRTSWGPFGIHPAMVFFANPVNLIMIFGQACDGMMTSLGIDLFNYSEKHVLPGKLIEIVDGLDLPAPFGNFSATIVMIPIKIIIVMGVVWLIDYEGRKSAGGDLHESVARRNLIGLVKMAIIMVGLSPGVRDAVRLAMAT